MKIGDYLWRYNGVGVAKYEVIGIIDRGADPLYEVRCLTCKFDDPCELILIYKEGGIIFSHMAKEPDCEYWHREYRWPYTYFFTENAAKIAHLEYNIEYFNEIINNNIALRDACEDKLDALLTETRPVK